MQFESVQQAERRRSPRSEPRGPIRVNHAIPVLPISDAEVLNTSAQGVAIRTRVPLKPGERLSFVVGVGAPPILAEVLAAETMEDGCLRVRCRCLLGGFEST